MSCCDPINSQETHDAEHAGQCPECGADVDKDGNCVETDDCSYSPICCEKCNHRPCDGSC